MWYGLMDVMGSPKVQGVGISYLGITT